MDSIPDNKNFNDDKTVHYTFVNSKKNTAILFVYFEEKSEFPITDQLISLGYNMLIFHDADSEYNSYFIDSISNSGIETIIENTILEKMNENNILLENISMLGTNSGGSAALYYGAKLGVNKVIVGNPHSKIGTFNKKHWKNNLKYLVGANSNIKYLDEYIEDSFATSPNLPIVNALFSENLKMEAQIENLQKLSKNFNVKNDICVDSNIRNLTKINLHFVKFVQLNLLSDLYKVSFENINLDLNDKGELKVNLNKFNDEKNQFTFSLVVSSNKKEMLKSAFKMDENVDVKSLMNGVTSLEKFNVSLLIKVPEFGEVPVTLSKKLIVTANYILLEPTLKIKEENLHIQLQAFAKDDLKFAYYLKGNNAIIDKKMYDVQNTHTFKLEKYGYFKVKVFILNGGKKYSFETNSIKYVESNEKMLARIIEENAQLKKQLNNSTINYKTLYETLITEKKEKLEAQEKIVAMLQKEATLLKSYKKLLKRYSAISNSKLGKLTLQYWKFIKKVKRG